MRIIIATSIWLLFSQCSTNDQQKEETAIAIEEDLVQLTPGQAQQAGIQVTSLNKQHLPLVLPLQGIIEVPPQNLVSVTMPMGGYLKSTKLLPGMHINKGEVLAVMEDQQYIQLQQDFLEVQSKLQFTEKEWQRQKNLNADKTGSDKQLNMVSMEYENLRIQLKGLSEKLILLGIRPEQVKPSNIRSTVSILSPIDGFVTKVNVNIGKYVNPTDVLFELVNPEDIHLNLRVFENDFKRLSIGQKVFAYTNEYPDKKYICDIILISKDVKPDRSVEVHCHFEQYDKSLIPGMYMNAEVELDRSDVAVLPEESVLHFQGKDYVFVQEGKDKYRMTEIKTGAIHAGLVEVPDTSRLAGRSIVQSGAYTLLMALKNKEE